MMSSGAAHRLALLQCADNLVGDVVCPAKNICLPEAQDKPATGLKCQRLATITLNIASNLCSPVVSVVSAGKFRKSEFQVAAVPEVAITEDGDLMLGKNNIRAAKQFWMMEAVTQTALPKLTSQY
jgi:hypothetical protein